MTTGSDSGYIYKFYGFDYIRELEFLREAGLLNDLARGLGGPARRPDEPARGPSDLARGPCDLREGRTTRPKGGMIWPKGGAIRPESRMGQQGAGQIGPRAG